MDSRELASEVSRCKEMLRTLVERTKRNKEKLREEGVSSSVSSDLGSIREKTREIEELI